MSSSSLSRRALQSFSRHQVIRSSVSRPSSSLPSSSGPRDLNRSLHVERPAVDQRHRTTSARCVTAIPLASKSLNSIASRPLASLNHRQQRVVASKNSRDATRVAQLLSRFVPPRLTFSSSANPAAAPRPAKPAMFCFQCEQTEHHTGCTVVGNCGKTSDVAALQDLLVYVLKSLSFWAAKCKDAGLPVSHECDVFTMDALFSTLTNVNFDRDRFPEYINKAIKFRDEYRELYRQKKGLSESDEKNVIANYTLPNTQSPDVLSKEGEKFGVFERKQSLGDDIAGVQELIVYGLKGTAAYQSHASELDQHVQSTFDHVHKALALLCDPKASGDLNNLVSMAMKTGEANLHTMEALEKGHISRFGNPEPTAIRISTKKGKCILVSGHDMWMLEDLLKQTEGKGINVYTHGELLPANTYPGLKKYKHLIGNYGGPWQLQKMEFSRFPGPIVVTTNCLIEPRDSYKDRVFTMGQVGWNGVKHLQSNDFSQVIQKALDSPGFTSDEPEKTIMGGFGRAVLLSVADKILSAVQAGALKRIFLIGGCDGSEGERNYYKELAVLTPKDTAILTLGCGKYRFNKLDLGTLPGLNVPRVLDMGQCNDAYGAIAVAGALAKALNTDVNKLPISYAISWFEQKAVAVFLTMLHLGIKNIRVGPALPAFISPNVLNFLVSTFDLKPANVKNVAGDLQEMMGGK